MNYLLTHGLVYYVAVITGLSVLAVILLSRRLSFLEKVRRKRLSKADNDQLLASHANTNIDKVKIKEQSLISIENRFTITRRSLYLALLVTALFIASIPFLGNFSPTLISVLIACISVILGIAAKPFIENMICGLVLSFGKLARIGDIVLVDNEYGTIEDVTLTHCIIRRWDWLRYVVPNSQMMTKEFTNYSLRDNYRWVHVEFWIDNRSDLKTVENIAKASPLKSIYYSGNEEPRFWVIDITQQAAKCMVVAWATSAADGWMLSIDIRKNLLEEFKKNGIQTHLQNISVTNPVPDKQTGV